MLVPCRDCKHDGRCEQQIEVAKKVLHSWTYGALVECKDREERFWRGIEGVAA